MVRCRPVPPRGGSTNENSLPPSRRGSAQMRPFIASTRRRETYSPIPAPPAIRAVDGDRKKGLKIASASSGSMPGPVSRTRTTTPSSSRSTTTDTTASAKLYLAALDSRFRTTWVMLVSSPLTAGRSGSTLTSNRTVGQRLRSWATTAGTRCWSRAGSSPRSIPSSNRASTSRSSTRRYSRSASPAMSARISPATSGGSVDPGLARTAEPP
jgi:hypothetical protein